MNTDVVMGACFGDEGKGTLTNWLSRQKHYDICIGPFGCQSSHTYYRKGVKIEGHHTSNAWENSDVSYVPAASVINPKILLEEYKARKQLKPNFKLYIHFLASVTYGEQESEEYTKKGSMGFGISQARADRILRKGTLAKDVEELQEFIIDPDCAVEMLKKANSILIESGQGYGLSQTGTYYPYVSSAICTPYGILANSGIPWNLGTVNVYLIMRPYLTRTPLPLNGDNGPFVGECTADELGIPRQFESWGSLKGKEMRYAHFDPELIKRAIRECNPTYLVLSWANWLIDRKGKEGIAHLESTISRKFDLLGIDHTEFQWRVNV